MWFFFVSTPCEQAIYSEVFRGAEASSNPSAADIINEALRLYPPTNRVYRKFHLAGKMGPEIVAAKIEACHRNYCLLGQRLLDLQAT